ncbi:hypothetical protein D9M68_648190 [compost metagenome]
MSFKIQNELSEDQVEADVASYLGYITPFWSHRFRLLSVDEGSTGADKLFNRFIPIFMQFKVPQGLNPNATILQQFLNKPLSKIIQYRKTKNLTGNPILYFQLRKKAKNAEEFQHNLLLQMHKPPFQYGLYVAPLTLELKEYEKLMNKKSAWYPRFYSPLRHEEMDLIDSSLDKRMSIRTNSFLRHHICFPPHQKTDSHEHHYSFSKNGADLAWHGGYVINGDLRMSTAIDNIFTSFYSYRESRVDFVRFIENLRDLDLKDMPIFDNEDLNNEERLITYIVEVTQYLKEVHQIKLMFLIEERRR